MKLPLKSLIVVYSYHHNNTQKVAEAMAKVLDAQVKTPEQTNPNELQQYDLIGFGSGIYAGRHHRTLRKFADELPKVANKKAFIFSTRNLPPTAQRNGYEVRRSLHAQMDRFQL
jgi:flavodoxin